MSPQIRRRFLVILWSLAALTFWTGRPVSAAEPRADIVIADFEGNDYGPWVATGEAFGRGPAQGTLPGQMEVTGFLGHGLVNSFRGGDDPSGTLTSPKLTIERPYLNFLIGGGGFAGETCLDLLIDDKVVRTTTGPNVKPGGNEQLDWVSWDISAFAGKTAVLRIVDNRAGSWGHINVDQIVQSDRRPETEPAAVEMVVAGRYLNLPVNQSAPMRRVRLMGGDATIDEFDIRLARTEKPEYYVFRDLESWQGKRLRFESKPAMNLPPFRWVQQSYGLPATETRYDERDRPQFHFTSLRGWLNDPNGLVWFEGEYHLFYQHNPYGWDWGNMHWGHAVSPDLVHWKEVGEALTPRVYGDWCFSGSAVVDTANTSGFGKDGTPPLVLAYTSTGRGECIAYSHDRGRTWTEFAGNPVLKHQGRDPRLFWHAPTKRWVMAVYDETGGKQAIDFHTSPDLKAWRFESRIDGFFECPDLFEQAVEGDPGQSLWVLSAADGEYRLGQFDGRVFTPSHPGKYRLWHGDFYAAQTFSNVPDGRRIQIGWGRGVTFPGMPFNQQMTVACELTLRNTPQGVRMFARPVSESAELRSQPHSWRDLSMTPGTNPLATIKGDLFEIRAEAEVGSEGTFVLDVRGTPIVYDGQRGTLSCGGHSAPLASNLGVVRIQVLVDRGSIELFGNDGRVAISCAIHPARDNKSLGITTTGKTTRVRSLVIDELKSAWR